MNFGDNVWVKRAKQGDVRRVQQEQLTQGLLGLVARALRAAALGCRRCGQGWGREPVTRSTLTGGTVVRVNLSAVDVEICGDVRATIASWSALPGELAACRPEGAGTQEVWPASATKNSLT